MKIESGIFKNRKNKDLQEVIVFGTGYFGMMITYLCRYAGIRVAYCLDNNLSQKGKVIFDEVVCKVPCYEKNLPIVISMWNEKTAREVYEQCVKLGYTDIIRIDHEKLESEFYKLPDKEFCELRYALRFDGKLPDLNNPKTFNEKLQWLKLYDRNPKYTMLVDKYAVKEYIAREVGNEYVIPTLGVWKSFEEIDFDKLPNQFVLKCTHDSGSVIVVKDKKNFEKEEARKTIKNALNKNFFVESREWPYKNVVPQIIAEKYIVDESGIELKDYKVFVFEGKAKIIQVDYDRFIDHKRNLYTLNWEHIDLAIEYPTDPRRKIEKPKQLCKMLEIAEQVAVGIPHVRVDFYSVGDKIYFGEMTFYHESGLGVFEPEEWNLKLGEWIVLPN